MRRARPNFWRLGLAACLMSQPLNVLIGQWKKIVKDSHHMIQNIMCRVKRCLRWS